MNFRTLIMLAVAALVIVVAVKMNRNPMLDNTVAVAPNATPEGYLTQESDAVIVDDEDAYDEDALENDGVIIEDSEGDMSEEDMDMENEMSMDENPNETEAVVNGETMSEEEVEAMEPALVDESPVEAVQDAPAEKISDEPVE